MKTSKSSHGNTASSALRGGPTTQPLSVCAGAFCNITQEPSVKYGEVHAVDKDEVGLRNLLHVSIAGCQLPDLDCFFTIPDSQGWVTKKTSWWVTKKTALKVLCSGLREIVAVRGLSFLLVI